MKYENKCPSCKHSQKLPLYFSDINDKLQPYESENVYIAYCPMIDDNVDETDWCIDWESEEMENDKKQDIADKVLKVMGRTNQHKWKIIFGYDCIHIELDKDNGVPLYTDTTRELETELNNLYTVIELNKEGNICLIYDVGVIDENTTADEIWEYEYRKIIKKHKEE